jgi:hypothetical protein
MLTIDLLLLSESWRRIKKFITKKKNKPFKGEGLLRKSKKYREIKQRSLGRTIAKKSINNKEGHPKIITNCLAEQLTTKQSTTLKHFCTTPISFLIKVLRKRHPCNKMRWREHRSKTADKNRDQVKRK